MTPDPGEYGLPNSTSDQFQFALGPPHWTEAALDSRGRVIARVDPKRAHRWMIQSSNEQIVSNKLSNNRRRTGLGQGEVCCYAMRWDKKY